MENITNEQYNEFCSFLEQQSGIVLGPSKQYLIVSRLTPLISQFKLNNLAELLDSEHGMVLNYPAYTTYHIVK